jgi:hypothetical protein
LNWLYIRKLRVSCALSLGGPALKASQTLCDFPALNELVCLKIDHSSNEFALFKVLDECWNLESLSLTFSTCQFNSDVGQNIAMCCGNLKDANFSHSDHIGNEFVQLFCASHHNITSLNFSGCMKFNDICLGMVCRTFILNKLNVSKISISSGRELECIINEYSTECLLKQNTLKHLDISGNHVTKVLSNFENVLLNNPLETLIISLCYSLIDANLLFKIAQNCKQLVVLGLRQPRNYSLDNLGLQAIFENCVKLTTLDLSGYILQLNLAVEMLNSLRCLSSIIVANNPNELSQRDVCVLLSGMIFSTVNTFACVDEFSISGIRHSDQRDLTVGTVLSAVNRTQSIYSLLPTSCLKVMQIRGGEPYDDLFEYFKSCSALESLYLAYPASDQILLTASAFCNRLKSLTIRFSEISDEGVIRVCQSNPYLSSVELINLQVSDTCLTEGLAKLRKLTELVLTLAKITSNGILPVLENNAFLTKLELCCSRVPSGKHTVKKALEKLKYLTFVKWDNCVGRFKFNEGFVEV